MCQVKTIKFMGVDDNSIKIKKNFVYILKMIGILLFVQEIRKFKTKKMFSDNKDTQELPSSSSSIKDLIKPGDVVRIRSKKQILETLDDDNMLEGCYFMDEMWQYCGSQKKVLKRVNYFFDERQVKTYKANNIVLLEGVHCSGKRENFMPICDRNCYLFWKDNWLEKVG